MGDKINGTFYYWLAIFTISMRTSSERPLAILKNTMTGKVELPLSLGKTASEYLEELIKEFGLKKAERMLFIKAGFCHRIVVYLQGGLLHV